MSVEAVSPDSLETIFNAKTYLCLAIFLTTYGLILSERINRAIVAMTGACLMILMGIMTQEQAFHSIDGNTIALLLGMMIIVTVMKESGVFQYVAITAAKSVKANPKGILAVFAVVIAVFSALLDNVTTVLLTTPIILLITRELDVKPYPYLVASIFAANVGGSATLIGDPTTTMIGSAAGLSFNDFIMNTAPVSAMVLGITVIPVLFFWRKDLVASDHNRERIMKLNAKEAIKDKVLLIKSLVVMGLVLLGFTVGHSALHIPPATFALSGAALLLFLDNIKLGHDEQHEKVHHAIAEAEWVTLFFFAGLFIVVHALQSVGIIDMLAVKLIDATNGDKELTMFSILWVAAIVSTLVDNIPFVATMIPMIQSMTPTFGGEEAVRPLWWALALGATMGGMGSLIGSSANLVVAGFAERAGHRMAFFKYMIIAVPVMLIAVCISTVYLWYRFG